MYEVGAGMLNAQAAVLEAAFSQRHFGSWRGIAYQRQVNFSTASQTFSGSATPGSASNTPLNIPANPLLSSIQVAWGDTLNPTNLTLSVTDAQGTPQAVGNSLNAPGLTGRRQRVDIANPARNLTARVETAIGATPVGTVVNNQLAAQPYSGIVRTTSAQYASLIDLASLDATAIAEMNQSFRFLTLAPYGQRFRPNFVVTRANLAAALVSGARVPQYLPAQSSYSDVRDRATMLFVESAQASPNGALFPSVTAGGAFQPDAAVDRLTAAVALVRAAGLRQQAESGSYPLTYLDAGSIPASLRGYVAVAVQNGLLKSNSTYFSPQGNFTRMDLAHALAQIAAR
jgi:hypothetical protein